MTSITSSALHALENRRISEFILILDATLAAVPCQLWEAHREHIYHVTMHVLLRTLGAIVSAEPSTAKGRADVVLHTAKYIYCFEFKVDIPASEAFAQIIDRGYLEPYVDGQRQRVAVGISFDSRRRQVGDWVEEQL